MQMSARPAWLERYRVRNIFRNRKNKKAVYIDKNSDVVKATHYNLLGGVYSVPRDKEESFMNDYVTYVFGPNQGRLALTENAIVSDLGVSFSPVFIDLDLRYPLHSEGR